MSITLRDMTSADLDALEQMEQTSARNAWKREQRAAELTQPHICVLAADWEGQLAGILDVHLAPPENAHIMDVLVDVECRRRGIADALLSRALDIARQKDCACVTLEVRVHNPAALALYEKHGFSRVCIKQGYYRNPEDDAYSMIKFL